MTKTITAEVANARITRWQSGELIFRQSIVGEVRVPSGCTGRIVFEKPITGKLVVGGYVRSDAPFGVLDKSEAHIIGVSDPNSTESRPARRLLRYDGEGERVRIAHGLRVEAVVQGMVFGSRVANSSFDLEIDGTGRGESHGALFVECLDVRATGSVKNVGIQDMTVTSQGYGIELQSCVGCTVSDVYGEGVRYIVSLTDSGDRNAVHRITGTASVSLVDAHGGSETNLVVTDVDGLTRFGNGWWKGYPINPTTANLKELLWVEPLTWK